MRLSVLLILWWLPCLLVAQPAKEGHIRAGGLQLYYQRTGTGTPLVLLHAGLQDHTMWAEQVRALAPHFTVITPDLPYHGRTRGTDTTLLAADAIRILLDSLHLDRVHIAGLSMGAAVVQDFVIAYPARVQKVVLISAGINGYERRYPIDSVSMSWYGRFTAALEAKDTAGAAMVFTQTWAEGAPFKGNRITKPAAQYVHRTTLQTLRQHRLTGWPHLQENPTAMEGIGGIKAPVLIIHGDGDVPFVGVASRYLEKTIPAAKRVQLAGVAHMLNMEKPAEVNRLILEFLK